MCLTQKFSFSADPVILDLKLQLAYNNLYGCNGTEHKSGLSLIIACTVESPF